MFLKGVATEGDVGSESYCKVVGVSLSEYMTSYSEWECRVGGLGRRYGYAGRSAQLLKRKPRGRLTLATSSALSLVFYASLAPSTCFSENPYQNLYLGGVGVTEVEEFPRRTCLGIK